jgi:subtilisin family serine protease
MKLAESGIYATAVTQDPGSLDPQGATEHGAFYVLISGTSMSCPVVAAICAQVMEAWYTNNGAEYPAPEQAIRIIEGTAEESLEDSYTPYNVSTGFINAKRPPRWRSRVTCLRIRTWGYRPSTPNVT